MKDFLSELKAIIGPGVLARVVQDARERPAGARGTADLLVPALLLPVSHIPRRTGGARAERPAIGEQGSDRQVGASLIRRRRHSCASIACATRPASLGLVAVGR